MNSLQTLGRWVFLLCLGAFAIGGVFGIVVGGMMAQHDCRVIQSRAP